MLKKYLISALLILPFLGIVFVTHIQASELYKLQITPIACQGNPCPAEMPDIYTQISKDKPADQKESCARDFQDFMTGANPTVKHFWAEDPEITNQGKS